MLIHNFFRRMQGMLSISAKQTPFLLLSIIASGFSGRLQAMETFNMSLVVGPLISKTSLNDTQSLGGIGGAIFTFSPGALAWEFELLGALRRFETTANAKVGVIHGQFGAIMRGYLGGGTKGKVLSIGIGPYVAKPLRDHDSILTEQLEVGGALSLRLDPDLSLELGPFGIGILIETRLTGGGVIKGTMKPTYFDASAFGGIRFGVL